MKNNIPYEAEEQRTVFSWARSDSALKRYPQLIFLNGSLNGVKLSGRAAGMAKQQGLVRGYPDINLPVKNKKYNGLYIELKRIKGGTLSPAQKVWIEFLNSQGYKAVVCKGHLEAIKTIKNYLE